MTNPFPYVREGAYRDDVEAIDSGAEMAALIFPAWSDWTPTLTATTTAPTLSNNASHIYEGRYLRVGKLAYFRGQIRVGSAGVNAGSGIYKVALPVTARLPDHSDNLGGFMVGQFALWDASTSTNYGGGIACSFTGDDGDHAVLAFAGTTGAVGTSAILVSDSNPFTLAASDEFEFWGFYETA